MWFVKSRRAKSTHDYETWVEGGVSPTLNATTGAQAVASVEPTLVFQPGPMVRLGARIWEDIVPTLRAEAHGGDAQPYIAREEPLVFDGYNQSADDSGIHRTLRIGIDSGDCVAMPGDAIVRRLTPMECERLMGWPDNHTLHRADGKTNSDSTRYKMCGNGVATPVARWIAEQLQPLLES